MKRENRRSKGMKREEKRGKMREGRRKRKRSKGIDTGSLLEHFLYPLPAIPPIH